MPLYVRTIKYVLLLLFSIAIGVIYDICVFKGVRRQGSLAFSLFGCLLAHGDLRNNKLNQLAVNLWNLSHKHGFCDTRTSVSRTHNRISTRWQIQCPDLSLSLLVSRCGLWSTSNIRCSRQTWAISLTWRHGCLCSPEPDALMETFQWQTVRNPEMVWHSYIVLLKWSPKLTCSFPLAQTSTV